MQISCPEAMGTREVACHRQVSPFRQSAQKVLGDEKVRVVGLIVRLNGNKPKGTQTDYSQESIFRSTE
jgi:hypothetical protein